MAGTPLNRAGFTTTATIAASGTKTDAIEFQSSVVAGVALPATFTGTAITFEVSQQQSGTYQALHNSSGAISMTVAQGKSYALPSELAAWPWFKIVSGSTESSARSLVIVRKR